jgi:hypothetical protein
MSCSRDRVRPPSALCASAGRGETLQLLVLLPADLRKPPQVLHVRVVRGVLGVSVRQQLGEGCLQRPAAGAAAGDLVRVAAAGDAQLVAFGGVDAPRPDLPLLIRGVDLRPGEEDDEDTGVAGVQHFLSALLGDAAGRLGGRGPLQRVLDREKLSPRAGRGAGDRPGDLAEVGQLEVSEPAGRVGGQRECLPRCGSWGTSRPPAPRAAYTRLTTGGGTAHRVNDPCRARHLRFLLRRPRSRPGTSHQRRSPPPRPG